MADDTQHDGQQPETGDDWQAKFEAQRKVNRDLERKLRETQTEAEKVRNASLSDAEKAIAEAEARGRAAATAEFGGLLVDEAFRAVTAGRALKPDALLEFDRAAFLGDDGRVKRDALTEWVTERSVDPPAARFGSVDQGVRTSQPSADGDERATARALFGSPKP